VEGKDSLQSRDKADSSRKLAPMVAAEDAIEIDTSEMSIEEVVELIEKTVFSKLVLS
jgi:cytidylate kinase